MRGLVLNYSRLRQNSTGIEHSTMFDFLIKALSAANAGPSLSFVHSVLHSSGAEDRGQGRETSVGSGEDNNWGMDDNIDVNAVCMFACVFCRGGLLARHGRVSLTEATPFRIVAVFLLRERSLSPPAKKAVHIIWLYCNRAQQYQYIASKEGRSASSQSPFAA